MLSRAEDDRLFVIYELLLREVALTSIEEETRMDLFFLHKLKNIADLELRMQKEPLIEILGEAKKMGFFRCSPCEGI